MSKDPKIKFYNDSTSVMRGLLTDGELYSLVEGSIAGFATLNLGGQTWGVGVRGWTGGNTNGYTFARKGVEAEGSHLFEQIVRGLDWIA